MKAFSSITDLWDEYVNLCGESQPGLMQIEIEWIWNELGCQWGAWYNDSELDTFWNNVFHIPFAIIDPYTT